MTRSSKTLATPNALQQKDMPPAAHPEATAVDAMPAAIEQQWIRICAVDEITARRAGSSAQRRTERGDIRTATDALFALADTAPSRRPALPGHRVRGARRVPLHNTCVELDTGSAVAPDKGQVRRYGVKSNRSGVRGLEVRVGNEGGGNKIHVLLYGGVGCGVRSTRRWLHHRRSRRP